MTDLLRSLKSDLTSRRLLPLLILAALALAAAAGYAVTGGTSPSTTANVPSATASAPSATPAEGPEVSSAPANPHDALAETTSGGSYQHHGHVRNPFKPLPSSEAPSSPGSGKGGSSSSASTSGEGGATGGKGKSTAGGEGSGASGGEGSRTPGGEGSSGAGEGVPSTLTLYKVSATLTTIDEEGKPAGASQTFTDMVPVRALPSKKKPLLAFLGVAKDGSDAVFLLVQPAILHGPAKCVPSPSDCEGIELAAGETEELQYLEADGTVVAYRLKVTKLKKSSASETEVARRARTRGGSKADAELIAKLHVSYSAALLAATGPTGPISTGSPSSAGSSSTAPAGSTGSSSAAPE